jgi:hypothetical protein
MTHEKCAAELFPETMPSLEHLDTSLRGKRFLGNLMGIHGPPTARGKQIADGYVRLVEKAVIEYQQSREKLVLFIVNRAHEFDNYCRAQDHIESCIQSLHRAILYLDKLRGLGFRQADGSPFVPKPRELTVLRHPIKDRVRDFRDVCEHLDNDIICGNIWSGEDAAVHLGWDGVDLAGKKISYVELAKWLEQLHRFALLLSRVQITVGEPIRCANLQ